MKSYSNPGWIRVAARLLHESHQSVGRKCLALFPSEQKQPVYHTRYTRSNIWTERFLLEPHAERDKPDTFEGNYTCSFRDCQKLIYKLAGELQGETIAYRLAGLSDTADPPQTQIFTNYGVSEQKPTRKPYLDPVFIVRTQFSKHTIPK